MNDITVLIPAYNSERTLAETLESLIMQNFKDFNVLIVDDGSSDQTIAVAKKFISQLNLEIFSLSKNSGISRALNHGLSHIQSKYIARLDADDLAMPTRLKEQFDYLESHPNIDVCSSWIQSIHRIAF